MAYSSTVPEHWHSNVIGVQMGKKPVPGCAATIAPLIVSISVSLLLVFGAKAVNDGIHERDRQIEHLQREVRTLKAGPK